MTLILLSVPAAVLDGVSGRITGLFAGGVVEATFMGGRSVGQE